MKAIIQNTYGSTDVLEFRDIEKPSIAASEVLVQVRKPQRQEQGTNENEWADCASEGN